MNEKTIKIHITKFDSGGFLVSSNEYQRIDGTGETQEEAKDAFLLALAREYITLQENDI